MSRTEAYLHAEQSRRTTRMASSAIAVGAAENCRRRLECVPFLAGQRDLYSGGTHGDAVGEPPNSRAGADQAFQLTCAAWWHRISST